jgi:hypothetical protein
MGGRDVVIQHAEPNSIAGFGAVDGDMNSRVVAQGWPQWLERLIARILTTGWGSPRAPPVYASLYWKSIRPAPDTS